MDSADTTLAEVHSLASYVAEEMEARGWKTDDVAARMRTPEGSAIDLFCLDLMLCVQDDNLIIDAHLLTGLACAFDVSPEFFGRLHRRWLDNPDRRVPFECPEHLFGPASRRTMIRLVPQEKSHG